ncbi:hypothetical protein LPJ57_005937 [Coemansia sp. RSA 486]|nr:hypothetical protein LPJ57_005937 [Coemansia sp. RSA 486]
MSWRYCNVYPSEPEHCYLKVPMHPGEYTYYLQKKAECGCSNCNKSDTRYRTYYDLLMKSSYLSSYSCKDVYAAYKNAVQEEDKENEAKWNMSKDQYKDYLQRYGYSTDNLNKVQKPKLPHCPYEHNEDGEHLFCHYSNFGHHGHHGCGHHHAHHGHGCWHH